MGDPYPMSVIYEDSGFGCEEVSSFQFDSGKLSHDSKDLMNENYDDRNVEEMLLNILDERDRLMEDLNDTQKQVKDLEEQLVQANNDKETLDELLNSSMPQDIVQMSRELHQVRKLLNLREEEVTDLKAERNNIKLLLEHLESLVSRHEKSLRAIVCRRQTNSSISVSSEVEVLKALKSLFEHHKALDENVREHLRVEIERNFELEKKLAEYESGNSANLNLDPNVEKKELSTVYSNYFKDYMQNQSLFEQHSREHEELSEARLQLAELSSRFSELQDILNNSKRESFRVLDQVDHFQKKLKESELLREDYEARIATLESRYLIAQRENSFAQESVAKIESELVLKETELKHMEEKLKNYMPAPSVISSLDLAEANTLDDDSKNSSDSLEILGNSAKFSLTNLPSPSNERFHELEAQLEELRIELNRSQQRESVIDQQNIRLNSKVDQLLRESNELQQCHLIEKMQILEQKTRLKTELEKTRGDFQEITAHRDHLLTEMDRLRNEMSSALTVTAKSTAAQAFALSSKIHKSDEIENCLPSSPSPTQAMEPDHWGTPPAVSVLNGSVSAAETTDSAVRTLKDNLDLINSKIQNVKVENEFLSRLHPFPPQKHFLPLVEPSSTYHPRSPPLTRQNPVPLLSGRLNQNFASSIGNNKQLFMPKISYSTLPANLLYTAHQHTQKRDSILPEMPPRTINATGNVNVSPSSFLMHSTYANLQPRLEPNLKGGIDLLPQQKHQLALRHDSSQNPLLLNMSTPNTKKKNLKILTNTLNRFFKNSSTSTSSTSSSSSSSLNSSLNSRSQLETYSPSFDKQISENVQLEDYSLIPVSLHTGEALMRKKEENVLEALLEGVPFDQWNTKTIANWLETWVGMLDRHVTACRANVKSGSIMRNLSDHDMQRELGIDNALHRLKLRLAIQEMSELCDLDRSTLLYQLRFHIKMGHEWINSYWLESLGLSQYKATFMECLVDVRMLPYLNTSEIFNQLKMHEPLHKKSLIMGIKYLYLLKFNLSELKKRQDNSSISKPDLMVMTNRQIIMWLENIGLNQFAKNLLNSGVHGALFFFEDALNLTEFVEILRVPTHQQHRVLDLLTTEFEQLKAVSINSKNGDSHFLNYTSNDANASRQLAAAGNLPRNLASSYFKNLQLLSGGSQPAS